MDNRRFVFFGYLMAQPSFSSKDPKELMTISDKLVDVMQKWDQHDIERPEVVDKMEAIIREAL